MRIYNKTTVFQRQGRYKFRPHPGDKLSTTQELLVTAPGLAYWVKTGSSELDENYKREPKSWTVDVWGDYQFEPIGASRRTVLLCP